MILAPKLTALKYIVCFLLFFAGCAGNQAAINEKAKATEQLGISHYRQGNLREALRYLLQAKDLDPENPDVHHALALVYRDLNEYDASLTHFEIALNLRPRFPEAWNNLGILYGLLEKWDLAIDAFQKAVNDILFKTPDIAYNNMGLAYYHKGDYKQAIKSYQKAIEIFPSYAICHANLGLAYEALNQWEQAIEAYKSSIRYDGTNPAPYLRLGDLYDRLGKEADAVSILKKFLGLVKEGPGVAEVQELLKRIQR
ncbi:MAG: tetratricopeptide repeat protein [Deltaproteobacteria bacterium]|nr:tetratricopeptide repeat protein [Deltaproteobacteria bacterium]